MVKQAKNETVCPNRNQPAKEGRTDTIPEREQQGNIFQYEVLLEDAIV